MSLVLNVEILGEFKKLTEATTGSQKSLSGLEDNAKKISKGINTALGAIGIGFSLNFLVNEFKESTKAAIEDEKSKVLLTKALKDNLNVTDDQVTSIEKYISKTQIATSVTDDKLRPAFAKLAIATKDTDKATRLMSVALDVAAGTGKNLDAVVQAMARSLAGSDTALLRLVPSIKGADDPLKALEQTFKGAAEAAANTDPYARMQVIFGEMQEQVGLALLPVLTQFSQWLTTPEGQEKLQQIVDGLVAILTEGTKIISWIIEWKDQLGVLVITWGAITAAVNLATGAVKIFNLAMANPYLLAAAGLISGIALGMQEVYRRTTEANSALAETNRLLQIQNALRGNGLLLPTPEQIAGATYRGIIPQLLPPAPKLPVQVPGKPGAVQVDINATIDANSVIKQINNQLKSQGSALRLQ